MPKLFDEPIVQFARPLAREEVDDGWSSDQKLAAIAPPAFRRVRETDAVRVARVPAILGGADLLNFSLMVERGKRRTHFRHCGTFRWLRNGREQRLSGHRTSLCGVLDGRTV